MSVASLVFQMYLLASVMVSSADSMGMNHCLNATDKLYLIESYPRFLANNNSYVAFIQTRQSCMFNHSRSYWNMTNSTFVATFDAQTLYDWSKTNGSIVTR